MNLQVLNMPAQAYSLLGIPAMAISRDFRLSSYTVADPPAPQAVFDRSHH